MNKIQKVNYLDFSKDIKSRGRLYLKAISNVLSSNTYILSSQVESFEKEFADYLGIKYCVGVANGLEAIQIALIASGVGKGDEVITTPISAMATTLAVIAVGATPIFVDVNNNGQIESLEIEKLITKRTKAVIPVDLYGQPCEWDKIKALCKKYKLRLIEDSCQAHGSSYKGKKLGTLGEVGCFSFYPTKNLGAFGDGGALVTNSNSLAKKFRQIRDYGQKSKYKHSIYGLNSRLDELHAAVLRVKLKFLDKDNNLRRKIARRYVDLLSKVGDVSLVLPENIDYSNFHIFVIRSSKRDQLKDYLYKSGIQSLIHYPITIPDQPVFQGKYRALKIPKSRKFVKEILSLPCYPSMSYTDVGYVSNKIVEFFHEGKR